MNNSRIVVLLSSLRRLPLSDCMKALQKAAAAREPAACREARRLQGEADAALAEDREDGGEGAGDEGISFGFAYGFL
jgi:ribosomal protein L12E/L44/L45/RPP1/RPP2